MTLILLKNDEIKGVAISLVNKENIRKKGESYIILSNWRGKRIRYIGENGKIFSTLHKNEFKKLPKIPKNVDKILNRVNVKLVQLKLI